MGDPIKKENSTETTETPEVQEKAAIAASAAKVRPAIKDPNEAFFGILLLCCITLSFLAVAGYFGFTGYRYFMSIKHERTIPSIESLPVVEEIASPKEDTKALSAETEVAPDKAVIDKKTLDIKVLNGGVATGVAGTYAEKLKTAGFTKMAIGNSFGSYTGATLYFAKDQEAQRDLLKEVIIKDYPALIVKEAVSGDKDATAAPLVLILGR